MTILPTLIAIFIMEKDIKHYFIAFLDGIRGLRTKCVDPEEELLFTGITMASTIDTRDSLKI